MNSQRERESSNSKLVSNFRAQAHVSPSRDRRGQGTIEYLVIIAIVVVISLVVVGLVMQQMGSSVNVSKTSNKIGDLTQSIGITESLVSPTDQNFVVKLLNNSGSTITISNVKIGDSNVNFSEDLAQSGSRLFKVRTDNNCELGKVVSQDVVITYVTAEGLIKTVRYPSQVMFDCSPFVIAQANLANQCPSCGSTCSGGSQSLSASSVSVAAGCYTATDLNVVDSDLNASNILDTATIFGIIGTASAGGGGAELHSGQTTSYDTGALDDKEQDGTAKSYTSDGCGGGTVLDNHTGLCWQKDHKDDCATLDWESALSYCSTLASGSGGLTDGSTAGQWRVPSNVELITLADYSYPSSSYLNSVFTQTGWNSTCYGYWSSTTVPFDTGNAYFLDSDNGGIYIFFDGKDNGYYYGARCVRSGS